MLLCLDVGNTHILGGIFEEEQLVVRFRYATKLMGTADQFGIFLTSFLHANQINPKKITAVAVCSVVPSCDYTIKHTIALYLRVPCFVLQAGVKTGLNIKYKNPNEVGADRISTAIGAVSAFPNQNMVVVDMGTATTLCAISKKRDYLGGTILPGMKLCMEALSSRTAKLVDVDIAVPDAYMGRTTKESIQAGLYYGQLGALKEILAGLKRDIFLDESVLVIGTGGFSQLFKDSGLFDILLPDLVLHGLHKAYHYSLEGNA